MSQVCGASLKSYQECCQSIWEDASESLEEYALYTTKNILQLKKSQDDAKLNRNVQEAIKKYIMEKSLCCDVGKCDIGKCDVRSVMLDL